MKIRELIYPQNEKKFFVRFNVIAFLFGLNAFLEGPLQFIMLFSLSLVFIFYIQKFGSIYHYNNRIRNSSLRFLGGVALGCAIQSDHIKNRKNSILIFGNDRDGNLTPLLDSLERIGVKSVDKIHVGYGRGYDHLKDFILNVVVEDKNIFKITHSDIAQIKLELNDGEEAQISLSKFYFVETSDLFKYLSRIRNLFKRFI